jgi:rhodanese-related sulfurtransferase
MMHKLFISVSVLVLIIAACKNDPAAPASTTSNNGAVADSLSISAQADTPYMQLEIMEFEKRVIGHPNIPIIDVRKAEDFKAGHLYSAINWPYDTSAVFYNRFETLDRRAPIALYCNNGYYSGQAGMKLVGMGFRKIYLLKGGLLQWMSEGKIISQN